MLSSFLYIAIQLPMVILRPFSSLKHFIAFIASSAVLILFFTSLLYFILASLMKSKPETESLEVTAENEKNLTINTGSIQIVICIFASLAALLISLTVCQYLGSITVDFNGQWMRIFSLENFWVFSIISGLFFLEIIGIVWSWARLYQILLIPDIFERYRKIIQVIPIYSASMILAFITGTWFFYSNIFEFWWFFLTFGVIFGLTFFFSYKDFKKRIRVYLSQSVEYHEGFPLYLISTAFGVILVSIIIVFHVVFKSMPSTYIIAPYIFLFIMVMYMTPGTIFRQIKNFPRFVSVRARILNFTRYTRRYLFAWLVILAIIGFLLGYVIIFDPNFIDPQKNLHDCKKNVKLIGESLEQYLKETNQLPDSKKWKKEFWLQKIEYDKKLNSMPSCPSGGVYVYRKWRDNKRRPTFEVRCSGQVHRRAGIDGFYPRYNRFLGPLINQEEFGKKTLK